MLVQYNSWLDQPGKRGEDAFMIKRTPHLGYPDEIDIDPTYRMIDEENREKAARFLLLKQKKS